MGYPSYNAPIDCITNKDHCQKYQVHSCQPQRGLLLLRQYLSRTHLPGSLTVGRLSNSQLPHQALKTSPLSTCYSPPLTFPNPDLHPIPATLPLRHGQKELHKSPKNPFFPFHPVSRIHTNFFLPASRAPVPRSLSNDFCVCL